MSSKPGSGSVAVIGYSSILPGGDHVEESWDMIMKGMDAIQDLPQDRVDVTSYWDPDPAKPDKIYCKRGGFIGNFKMKAKDYGLNMKQMEDCDANQLLTLVKVKEAINASSKYADGTPDDLIS